MRGNEECGKCGAFALPNEPLNHYGSCELHPNNIAVAQLQAKGEARIKEDHSMDATRYAGLPQASSPATFALLKGIMEIKLDDETIRTAVAFYLTNALNLPNIDVLSVTKSKKEFVVKFKGKEDDV